MLYIIGGASRSGKSILAERMCDRHGIPWFSLDALKMGLHLGAPALSIMPDADDLETADRMWPIVEPILDHAIFDRRDYLVEGVNIRPSSVAHFIHDTDQPVRACFLGYPHISIEEKALAVANHKGPPTDWLHRTGVENVVRYLGISRELSRYLRDECSSCGIAFFDTGHDFRAGLEMAETFLIEGTAMAPSLR